jgi:hypothetical protein
MEKDARTSEKHLYSISFTLYLKNKNPVDQINHSRQKNVDVQSVRLPGRRADVI